jgi:hypothetical protein
VAAGALAACAIAVVGCGGGGDDSSSASRTSTNIQIPAVTQPNAGDVTPSTTPEANGSGTAPAAPGGQNGSPGAPSAQEALVPFRQCLSDHGVSLPFLRAVGTGVEAQRQNSEQHRTQIEKAFVCIPELPPQIRSTAERFQRQFEQHNP